MKHILNAFASLAIVLTIFGLFIAFTPIILLAEFFAWLADENPRRTVVVYEDVH